MKAKISRAAQGQDEWVRVHLSRMTNLLTSASPLPLFFLNFANLWHTRQTARRGLRVSELVSEVARRGLRVSELVSEVARRGFRVSERVSEVARRGLRVSERVALVGLQLVIESDSE